MITKGSAVRRLESLAKGWPNDLWVWSADGCLYVMERGANGERVYSGEGVTEAVDPAYILATIHIPSDGGDW